MDNGTAQVTSAFDLGGQRAVQRIGPEMVAELKARFAGRRLLRLTSKAGEVVAFSPNMAEVDELRVMLDDKAKAGAAMEWLIRKCVVYPERTEVDALLARKPLLVEGWYKKLRDEAGAAENVEATPGAGFEAQYPGREVVVLTSAAARVTAKVPSPVEMREFRRRNHAGEREVVIADWLTRSCVVEPDAAGLNAILDRKPLLTEKWFVALVNAGGAAEEIAVGEL